MIQISQEASFRLYVLQTDFPTVDLDYLETVPCVSYHIKQSVRYIADHLTEEWDYNPWAYNNSSGLIRGQIRSRRIAMYVFSLTAITTMTVDMFSELFKS